MNNIQACFIIFTFVLTSSNWQPSSKVTVEAGSTVKTFVFGRENCWTYSCEKGECTPNDCECPNCILQFFGFMNCR
uniref:Putative secreted salivary protein n=1 Tax=Rhipicephalus pulchellus TaxID=72859 RepID=L7M144_RHIPC